MFAFVFLFKLREIQRFKADRDCTAHSVVYNDLHVSCTKHLTVESYTVVMLLTFVLIIISIPSPLTLSFQA